ncbi:hypothetical protein BDW59DRAFT_164408 [Aspergillus cavernicola]|uniref:PQ loop repeat protein n=1 Tax=Aspergillus cavernicola TaxID=176166 RepID=A0ABR4HZT0_9EURO
MPSEPCSLHIQTPLATAIHLLITLFVAPSYIPQLIKIATNDRTGNAGISGWYIILLTTSATAHLAARIKDLYSMVYLQAFIYWAAAITLLAFYVSFRTQNTPSNDNEGSTSPAATTASPSNATILTIVLTHAAILLPIAVYLLELITQRLDEGPDSVLLVLNSAYGIILRITGTLTSLTATIPQIHLMVTRYRNNRNNFDQGSLSLLGLCLQVVAFIALAGSQGWRMRVLPPPPDAPAWYPRRTVWAWDWWAAFFFFGGLAVGWVALAVCQLLVLCVALGLGGGAGKGRIYLKKE